VFLATTGIDTGYLITFLFVGFIVAFVAKGREMMATTTLGLIFAAMVVVVLPERVTHFGYGIALSIWNFSDSLAIVIAGAIVRTHRLRAAARHQQA
jgi:preprotein translocase subunit SecY